jgi:hypothetical protein
MPENDMQPIWLYRAKQSQSIAQAAIEFTENPYDRNKHVKYNFAYSAYKIFVECDYR